MCVEINDVRTYCSLLCMCGEINDVRTYCSQLRIGGEIQSNIHLVEEFHGFSHLDSGSLPFKPLCRHVSFSRDISFTFCRGWGVQSAILKRGQSNIGRQKRRMNST